MITTMTYTECPACSSTKQQEHVLATERIHECLDCGAFYGEMLYLVSSYSKVKANWCDCQVGSTVDMTTRYFDFMGLTSAGMKRRHGWYHTECGGIVQTG